MSIPIIGLCIYSLAITIWAIKVDARAKKQEELFELHRKLSDEIIKRLQNGEEF